MNNLIKLRAWDLKNKKMFSHEELLNYKFCIELEGRQFYNMPLIQYLLQWQGPEGQKGFIVQRFTGILDSEEKEIYEGDIVYLSWNTRYGKIEHQYIIKYGPYEEFENFGYGFFCEDFKRNDGHKVANFYPSIKDKDGFCYVIGNIFQNVQFPQE